MNQDFLQILFERCYNKFPNFPDKATAEYFIESLFGVLFLPYKGKYGSVRQLKEASENLRVTFSLLALDVLGDEQESAMQTVDFFDAIPQIYEMLLTDAGAILQFDPAAESIEEVRAAYPGFFATAVYRLAHQLYKQKLKTLPRLFTEYAHSKTGIDIHPGAEIGESFAIDHGTGIVIGETTVIGAHVKIYQGVTLGALNVSKELARQKRHPTIEDNVVIYSGATILGGETVVGHDSIVGGNAWLTYSIPPFSVAYNKSEITIRGKEPFPEPINFVI